MKLSALTAGLDITGADNAADTAITGLTDDSRQVSAGTLFVAMNGTAVDGARFIPSAIEKGAVAVLADREPDAAMADTADNIMWLTHPSPRDILPHLAARFYPGQPDFMAAVTGTDGKSSVAHYARQLWELTGHKAVSVGTIGVMGDHLPAALKNTKTANTTPGVVALHQMLSHVKEAGITHGVIEASSHGLDQHRLDGVVIQAAAFTNLSRDHLDYHETVEAYFEAKARLFTELLSPDGVAVLNADDEHFSTLCQRSTERGIEVVSFGDGAADIACRNWQPDALGMTAELHCLGAEATIRLPLIGKFQLTNIMTALGLVISSGVQPKDALAVVEQLLPVPGRVEPIATHPNGAPILVDYAHTAGALTHVLQAVGGHVRGKLIVVFGCGGDRDKGKRPEMAQAASKYADRVIVTDDNPRTEDAAIIRREVMAGIVPGTAVQEIAGRAEAIALAIGSAEPDDMVLIAGKGHETEQIVGTATLPFDEKQIVHDILARVSDAEAVG